MDHETAIQPKREESSEYRKGGFEKRAGPLTNPLGQFGQVQLQQQPSRHSQVQTHGRFLK